MRFRGPGIFRRIGFTALLALLLLAMPLAGECQRVLIVTTEQFTSQSVNPTVGAPQNGEYVVCDLAAAGHPFDVVTYNRFVGMDLSAYDIIFLNGHTTPIPVADVYAKCQAAVQEGRKIFINGSQPYNRYSDTGNGTLVETQTYVFSLFGVIDDGLRGVTGPVQVPAAVEKDPSISALGIPSLWVQTFRFNTPPSLAFTVAGKTVGFLCPQGGTIDGHAALLHHVLDYGKIVTYLRFGSDGGVGFANDRAGGKPIVSFEVHCDYTRDLVAIDAVKAASDEYGVPLTCLLVYNQLNSAAAAKWNSIAGSPLIRIGSHSRSHPMEWPPLPNPQSETTGALADQRLMVPSTGDYFNFSGRMDPTREQIDQLYPDPNIVFGAFGYDDRRYDRLDVHHYVQHLPTTWGWFINLSRSTSTPYCLSQTMHSDYITWKTGIDFTAEVIKDFQDNVKYGLYTYAYIHDYYFNPANDFYTNGIHLSEQIRDAFEYLESQNVQYMFTEDLILRLRDFVGGRISTSQNPDGSLAVSVYRPAGRANEIKVHFRGDLTPVVTGSSVTAQRFVGDYVYVTLASEVTSAVNVEWELLPPGVPAITEPHAFIRTGSTVRWTQPYAANKIAEYQYALGTSAGGTECIPWTSTGLTTSATINASLTHGRQYYLSVRSRYATGTWSDSGTAVFTADCTAPGMPTVTDDGYVQLSSTSLHASWSANDPESGIAQYTYAIGTTAGGTDVVSWTETTQTQATVTHNLTKGQMYYFTVKAQNGAGGWGAEGTSDGICYIGQTIGLVRDLANGFALDLRELVVTAVFPDGFYAEELDRSAAIKVEPLAGISQGMIINLTGTLSQDGYERIVRSAAFTEAGTVAPEPLFIADRNLGGLSGSVLRGATNGRGLNTAGLLVRTWGKIRSIGTDYVLMDDGSDIHGESLYYGVKVRLTAPHDFQVGQKVIVTGISALDLTDTGTYRRAIRTRTNSDVVPAQ